eukprot:5181384-Amphidinium_carterae.1
MHFLSSLSKDRLDDYCQSAPSVIAGTSRVIKGTSGSTYKSLRSLESDLCACIHMTWPGFTGKRVDYLQIVAVKPSEVFNTCETLTR